MLDNGWQLTYKLPPYSSGGKCWRISRFYLPNQEVLFSCSHALAFGYSLVFGNKNMFFR